MHEEISPSFVVSMRIWWNITWKTIVFGIPFSFAGGFFGAMIGMIATGGNDPLVNIIGSVCSWLAVVPIAILVIKSSLNENYGKYRVSISEIQPEGNADSKVEPEFRVIT